MAENEKVTIKIETQADLKGVNAAQKGIKNLSVEIKKTEQESKSFGENLREAFKTPYFAWETLKNALKAGLVVLKQGIQFANEAIQAHLANARAVKTLEASYQALGITGTQALKNAKAFAGEMQNATGIADEVFLDAQRMLANFGVVGQKAQEAIKAAYALSVGRNMEFASALDLVTRAAAGQTQTLARQGIQIADNVKECDKFDAVLAQINDKFGAAAQAQMGDTITQVNALKESWGDFKEVIGGLLIPAFELLIKTGTKAVNFLNSLTGADQNAIEATIAKDKKRLELLNRRYMIEQQSALVNAKNGQIGEVYAKRLKDLENEMLMVSSAITENQKTLNNEKADLAAKEAEINANTYKTAQNALAAKEAAQAKKTALEAQNNALKEQQSIVSQMGLDGKKTEGTSSWGTLTNKDSDLSDETQFAAAEERLNEMLELKRQYIEAEISDAELKNNALLELDNQYLEQLSALEDQKAAADKKRQEKLAADKKAIEQRAMSDLISLSSSSNKQMAAIGKTASIAQATINTYEGATKALAQGGFFGFAMAAAVIAAGLNNVAQIAGVQLADGGLVKAVTGGVPALIGEGGSDEAVLPLDSQRSMSRIGQAISDAGGAGEGSNDINLNVVFSGELASLFTAFIEATRNGEPEALRYANISYKNGARESGMAI